MRVAAQSMLTLTANPRYLGGLVGCISVLQTWTRDLRYHPHVHMVVSGAGLSPDGNHWLRLRYRYLVPHEALSKLVRGKFRAALKKENLLRQIPSSVWRQEWVIDLRAVGSGSHALRYLAPYIFRVAISNRRILALKDGNVTFQFKNSKTKQPQIATLPANQFIARFLQHILPHRFIKVRTYGLFHPQKKSLLQQAMLLAGTPKQTNPPQEPPASSHYPETVLCPQCKKPMEWIGTLLRRLRGFDHHEMRDSTLFTDCSRKAIAALLPLPVCLHLQKCNIFPPYCFNPFGTSDFQIHFSSGKTLGNPLISTVRNPNRRR